jgi:hypothetical protein
MSLSQKYHDYINSQEWQGVKARYRASKMPQGCIVCKSNKVDIHHKTYKRFGNEHLKDLIPLCRQHHDDCHAFLRAKKMNLWGGTKRYLMSLGLNQLGEPKKGKR